MTLFKSFKMSDLEPKYDVQTCSILSSIFSFQNNDFMLFNFLIANQPNKSKYLELLFKNSEKVHEDLFQLWALHCFILRYDNKDHNFYEIDNIFNSLLSDINDQMIEQIKPYLINPKMHEIMSDEEKRNFGFYLISFRESFKELFFIFKPKFQMILNEIKFDFLINTIGTPAISFFDGLQNQKFSFLELNFFEIKDVMNETFDTEILTHFQNEFMRKIPFPIEYEPSPLLSIINTSVFDRTHFFDVVSKSVLNYMKTLEIEKIPSVSKVINIIPFLLVAYQPVIYDNFLKFKRLIMAELPKTFALGIQTRMQNDYKILDFINSLSKYNNITIKDLYEHSFLFYFINNFKKNEILNLYDLKTFVYTDKEWGRDYDFIYSYLLIISSIEFILNNNVSYNYFTNSKNSFNKYYTSIKSQEIKKSIFSDIFSLLFIKKKGNYICSVPTANLFLQILQILSKDYFVNLGLNSIKMNKNAKSIDECFGTNHYKLLKSMGDKNWKEVEFLSYASPIYRKEFVLSNSINKLLNEKNVPIECSNYSKEFNIETGFSTYFIKDSLEYAEDSYAEFSKLIKERKNKEPDQILNPLISYKELTESVQKFDENPILFLKSNINIEKINGFINQIRMFFDSSDQKSIDFNVNNIISKCIESGNIQKSIEISQQLNIHIFQYVIFHLSSFKINLAFIKEFEKQYPLESQVLAVTALQNKEDLNSLNISSKIMRYSEFETDDKPNEDTLFLTAVTALENPAISIDFYDDFIYRIDHAKFCQALIQRIDHIQEDIAIYLLDIVGYTIDQTNKENIKKLLFLNDIHKIIKSKEHTIVVKELIERQMFDYLVQYITYFDTEKLLLYASELLLNDKKQLINLLIHFIDSLEFLSKENESLIPFILEICEKEKKDIFSAYLLLPSSVRKYSSMSDRNSIVKIISENPQYIDNIKEEQSILFKEEDFIHFLNLISVSYDIIHFMQVSHFLLNHIKNFEKVKGLIENKINNYIGSTKVESLEDEENLCITFSIVTSYSYMYKLSEHIQRKVRCFYNFLSSHPYKFLRIPYQFNNNNNNYDKLLRICFLYDLDKIAFELIRLLNLDPLRYILNRAYVPMILSQPNIVKNIFYDFENQFKNNPIDITKFDMYDPIYHPNASSRLKYNTTDAYSLNTPFLLPFSVFSLFHPDTINIIIETGIESLSCGMPSQLAIYRTIKFLCEKKNKKLPPENEKNRYFFSKRFTTSSSRVKLNISLLDFQNIIPLLFVIEDPKERIDTFIYGVHTISFACNTYGIIQEKFKEFDPQFKETKDLWAELISLAESKNMYNCLGLFYSFIGKYFKAANAYQNVFKNITNLTIGLFQLDQILHLLDKADSNELDPETIDSIKNTKELIKLQKKICKFFDEKKISINHEEIDIIHNDKAPIHVGGLIFQYCEKDKIRRDKLTSLICERFKISKITLIGHLCSILKDQDIAILQNFLEGKRNDTEYFDIYFSKLLQSLATSSKNWANIPSLIFMFVNSNYNKMKYFLEYNFLPEAFSLMFDEKDNEIFKELIPFIAYKASVLGLDGIVENCHRQFNN